jgi:hypothetical protein
MSNTLGVVIVVVLVSVWGIGTTIVSLGEKKERNKK